MNRKCCERLAMNVFCIIEQVDSKLSNIWSLTWTDSTISSSIGSGTTASCTVYYTGWTDPASSASNANSKSPCVYKRALAACSSSKPILVSVRTRSWFTCSLVICLPSSALGLKPSGPEPLWGFICLLIFNSEKIFIGSRKPPEQSIR